MNQKPSNEFSIGIVNILIFVFGVFLLVIGLIGINSTSLSNAFWFRYISYLLITLSIWRIIARYIRLNKKKVKGKIFEMFFFVFILMATLTLSFIIDKYQVEQNGIVFVIAMISSAYCGWLHYVEGIDENKNYIKINQKKKLNVVEKDKPKSSFSLTSRPLIFFVIIFWMIQIVAILTDMKNIFLHSFVNFILFIHLIIWVYYEKVNTKPKEIRIEFTGPLFFYLGVLYFLAITAIPKIISGPLWIDSCFFFGSLPLLFCTLYSLYLRIKEHKFDSSVIEKKLTTYHRSKKLSVFITVFSLLFLVLSPLIVTNINYISVNKKVELESLVTKLTKDCTNDTCKILSLLSWFNRTENGSDNIANIYYREKENKVLLNIKSEYYIFSEQPHFGVRTWGYYPYWIFARRCGRCGEFAVLFCEMAHLANLTVRKVTCIGEDHEWNEVCLNISGNETWIILDPTAVKLPNNNGFNLSRNFMEEKVRGEWRSKKVFLEEGNVSYVFAISPNATDSKIDITSRYTDTINITIYSLDSNNQTLSNVTISVYSHNSANTVNHNRVILQKETNEMGVVIFTLGGGNYTFKAEKGNFKGEKRQSFSEDVLHHDLIIILEKT